MIKIENTDVFGWETAVRGMRNPMNSWDKSDSGWCDGDFIQNCDGCPYGKPDSVDSDGNTLECFRKWDGDVYSLGKNDCALMRKLVLAGNDHSKFMRFINVTMDVTAPLYWWKEFDTYKIGTVANSCSTMHKIHTKAFSLEDFSCEQLTQRSIHKLREFIMELNFWRNAYNANTDEERCIYLGNNGWHDTYVPNKKDCWWQMIQLLPSSYNQRRTLQLNYAVLRNIYHARKNHKLDEWREFCRWIESLPYSELITE